MLILFSPTDITGQLKGGVSLRVCKNKPFRRKLVTGVTAFVFLAAVISADVPAKYVKAPVMLENRFVPAEYDQPRITDELKPDEDTGYYYKTNLVITPSVSGYPVYVRVLLAVSWQDSSGNIYGRQPVRDADYTLSYNEDDWFLHDGFYYCRTAVFNTAAPPLIKSTQRLAQLRAAPDGCVMHAEVAAETIQAVGNTLDGTGQPQEKAVLDAWGTDPTMN